jgi:hypothetical protein
VSYGLVGSISFVGAISAASTGADSYKNDAHPGQLVLCGGNIGFVLEQW